MAADPRKRTRRAILELLKQEGPLPAQAIAKRLDVTPMAVRQHLYGLQEEKLVSFTELIEGRGRPSKVWQLTSAADPHFPNGNEELVVGIIRAVGQRFGESGLDQIIDDRATAQAARYRDELEGTPSLKGKLQALARLRTREGYMAEVEKTRDGYLLIENHCPICAAAASCQGFCRSELDIFRSLMPKGVTVERTEHIISGSRRCVYRVSPHGE